MSAAAALPLAGCCIVTTRPAAQAGGLQQALAAQGAEVLNFPVISILPADPAALRTLDLEPFALAFFVSPNAVEQALTIRPRSQWPAVLRVATVGPGSARVLRELGWPDVIAPENGFDSEAVLALPEFSAAALAGRRVLLVRGEGGRELLAETLRERGAGVEQVSVYRRACAPLDPAPLLRRFRAGELSALVFTASEGLRFFLRITGESGRQMLRSLPCCAPHPRIAAALREAGAARVWLSDAGDAGIAASLAANLHGSGFAPSA